MEFSIGTEGYYRKMLHLQDKLRKSEEERLKLEEKFHEMMQRSRDVEHERLRIMRHRYHKFLEEDKIRQERNENILRALDRIEHRAKSLAAKTDRFKTFRKQYFDHYFKHLPPPVRSPPAQPMRESYATNVRKKLFPDSSSKSNENIEAKLALLEKYLRDNFDNFPGDSGTHNVPLDKQPPGYTDSCFSNENGVQEHEDMYKKYLSKKMANGLYESTIPHYSTIQSERNKLLGESIEKELEELRNKNVEPNNNSINIPENNAEDLIHDYKNLVSKSKEMYRLQDDLPIPTSSTKPEQKYLNLSNNNLTTFNRTANFEDIQTKNPKSNIEEFPVPQEPLFTSNLDFEENKNVDHEANKQLQNISLVSPTDQDLSTETKPPSEVSLNMSSPSLNKNLVDEEILSERDAMKNVEHLENKNNENMQEDVDEATIIENQLSVAPKEDSSYIEDNQKEFDEVLQDKSGVPSTKTQDEVSQNQEEYPTAQPYQQESSNVDQFDSNVNEFGETVYDEEQYQQEPQQYQEEPQAQEYVDGNDQEQYSQQVEEQQEYVEQQEPYDEEQYDQVPREQNKIYSEQEQYNEGHIVDGDNQYNQEQQQYVEEPEMYKQTNEEYQQQQYNEGEEQQYPEEQGVYDERQEYNEGQQEGQEQFIENQQQYTEEQSPYQENQEQYEQEDPNTVQYVENVGQKSPENYQQNDEQQDYPAYQQPEDETLQKYPQEQGEYNAEYSQENYAPVDQQYAENPENYDAQNIYQTQQEYIEGEQNIDMQYQEQNQYVENPISQEYQQEQLIEDEQGSQSQLNISHAIEEPNMPIIEKTLPNLADMLDTDTSESVKQDTKISNDSDFDFTNT